MRENLKNFFGRTFANLDQIDCEELDFNDAVKTMSYSDSEALKQAEKEVEASEPKATYKFLSAIVKSVSNKEKTGDPYVQKIEVSKTKMNNKIEMSKMDSKNVGGYFLEK